MTNLLGIEALSETWQLVKSWTPDVIDDLK